MHSFHTGASSFDQSIAIDASTVGGITVTVAVRASRTEELEVLDSIYSAAEGYDFYPFRDKSHDLEYRASHEFFEAIIEDNRHRLHPTVHLGEDGSDPERVEAVQSAVLVSRLGFGDSLVILDGDTDKAERFGRAVRGLEDSRPAIATCIQSELYYPTALLADICANHFANQINDAHHSWDLTPTTPVTKERPKNDLTICGGSAYHAMINSSDSVSTVPIEQRHAETVRGRMQCWYHGYMGGGESFQFGQSVRAIVLEAQRQGYDELADRLSDV